MGSTFDIFEISFDGLPVWRESVKDLKTARERLRQVARASPRRDCFIYSKDGGVVEIIFRTDFRKLWMTYSPHEIESREAS